MAENKWNGVWRGVISPTPQHLHRIGSDEHNFSCVNHLIQRSTCTRFSRCVLFWCPESMACMIICRSFLGAPHCIIASYQVPGSPGNCYMPPCGAVRQWSISSLEITYIAKNRVKRNLPGVHWAVMEGFMQPSCIRITLPETNIAMENPPFWWYLPGMMGIFMGELLVSGRVLISWMAEENWNSIESSTTTIRPLTWLIHKVGPLLVISGVITSISGVITPVTQL